MSRLPLLGGGAGSFVTIGNFRPDNAAATQPSACLSLGDRPADRPLSEQLPDSFSDGRKHITDRTANSPCASHRQDLSEALAVRRWRPA